MSKAKQATTGAAVLVAAVAAVVLSRLPLQSKDEKCACWAPKLGDCVQADGGALVRVGHNEFQPGQWKGKGCVEKECGAIYGVDNWPEGCAE